MYTFPTLFAFGVLVGAASNTIIGYILAFAATVCGMLWQDG